MQYFSARPNVWIKEEKPSAPNVYALGFDLVSPNEATHKGIVYQNRKEQRSNNEEQNAITIEGSSLLKKEKNHPKENSERSLDSRDAFVATPKSQFQTRQTNPALP